MNVTVIGGAGFIGSNLVDKLIELNHQVIVIDDLSTGKEENLNPKAEFSTLDVSDPKNQEALVDIFKKNEIEVVFHLAAWARVVRSVEDPLGTNRVNTNSLLGVLEAMRKAGIKQLVYSSSSSIYGDQDTYLMKENMKPHPKSPYAMQKLIGEHWLTFYVWQNKFEAISLRYFNVYGPRQVMDGEYALVIGKFMAKKAAKKNLTIYGDGKQTRAYTYVLDVVNANLKSMEYLTSIANISLNGYHKKFNIGTDQETSVNEIADLVGGKIEHIIPNPRGNFEEMRKAADYTKAKEVLGWEPTISIEEGIQDLLKYE